MSKLPIAALALFSLAVVSCAGPPTSPTARREAAVRSRTAVRSQLGEAGSTEGLMSMTPTSVCALTAASQMFCWGANGQPIAGALAASLGCTVNVSLNGGSPVCADYAPGSAQFHANINTSKSLTAGATYLLSITVTVGPNTVTNATFALVAK